MCGIFGVASTDPLTISDGQVCRLRDLMTHRGPDDAGLWRGGNVALAHRRLAVLDTSPAGRQPMVTADGRFAIVYNGELYNEPDLRRELARDGRRPATACDTETLLTWLATRGLDGLRDLRGMYALAIFDTAERTLTLARDPLGVKPLYWWRGRSRGADIVVFASEPASILAHPAVSARPDLVGVSAYLTTIRTSVGERTLFEGVRALPPGRVLTLRLGAGEIREHSFDLGVPRLNVPADYEARVRAVGECVRESVAAHLRADVPTCCLLSGGLDSAIVTSVAAGLHAGLRTYCAGSPDSAPIDGVAQSEDLRYARHAAARLGTRHAEAHVDEGMFVSRWREMVARSGLPLSTPNEVAINEVARRLRADGNVVTLSGEGADELFGGYDESLRLAAEHVGSGNADPGHFQLALCAWCPPEAKAGLFTERACSEIDGDSWLRAHFEAEFARTARGDDPPTMLADHLRFQRRTNLAGLLQRLDSATMLASVEGRTPFADVRVAALAESLPIGDRYVAPTHTKRILRDAFRDALPAEVLGRPKASFPLPFQRWVRGAAGWIRGSAWLREVLRPEAVEMLAWNPGACWRLAWPAANLALWADRWWPDQPGGAGPGGGRESLAEAIAAGGPSPTVSTQ